MTESQQPAIRMYDLEEEDEDDEDMKRALEQSQAEDPSHQDDEEYRRALEVSQVEHETQKQHEYENGESDEAALRRAIEASQAEQQQLDDEEELKRALAESERAHQQEMARINSLRSEEDIVLEYVKKQSLAEAAFRDAAMEKNASPDEDEDEQLRRAWRRV